MLPNIFYPYTHEDGTMGVHPQRWMDDYSHQDGKEKLILTYEQIKQRDARDMAYGIWRSLKELKPRKCKFQLIQILKDEHSERNKFLGRKDWWPNYKDALFRVWMEPETIYDNYSGDHKQWYVICPEDCELITRTELEKKGINLPPRSPITERWVSAHKELRKAYVVPVECCRHFRHETTAGRTPIGL